MAKYSDLFEDKYKEALKSKDPQTVSVLRLLKAAFVNERIAKGHELSDEEEAAVIRRLLLMIVGFGQLTRRRADRPEFALHQD